MIVLDRRYKRGTLNVRLNVPRSQNYFGATCPALEALERLLPATMLVRFWETWLCNPEGTSPLAPISVPVVAFSDPLYAPPPVTVMFVGADRPCPAKTVEPS